MLKFRKGLAEMPSYDVTERDWKIKVNANECNLNLPPLVEERVMSRLSRVAFNRYPNEEPEYLKEQIADNFGLETNNVLLGNGSSEIIEKLFYCFGGGRHKIVFPQPSFSMYRIYAKAAEAEGIPVDLEDDYTLDADKFIKAVRDSRASLAVLCNPNNPTGTVTPLEKIKYIADNINCAFLVDEAYVEFYGSSAVSLLEKYPNLMVARTFSKAYGLASARVGYLLGNEAIIEMISKSYMPYHLNVLSCVTADIVYQMRHEYVPRIQMMVAERKRMAKQLKELKGFTVYPSETNFLLVKYEKAVKLNKYLEERGIGVRSFGNAPRLENCLRISMGTREENDTWFKAIKDFVEERQ